MGSSSLKIRLADVGRTSSDHQGEYSARLIDCLDRDEASTFHELRFNCFVLQKGWVAPDPAHPGIEIDRYDPFCHHVGVFRNGNLLAYLRLLPWQEEPGFMLEHEFRDLIPEAAMPQICRQGHAEASRLVVAPPPGTTRAEVVELAELLFRMAYTLGKRLGWTGYTIVLEEAWLRVINKRFNLSFTPLGPPHVYPDGTRTVAAFASREALEQSMLATLPDKYWWYQGGANGDESLLLSPTTPDANS